MACLLPKKTGSECRRAHVNQQKGTMGTENTRLVFICGLRMKHHQVAVRVGTKESTSQFSVLGRSGERWREETFLSTEPCGKNQAWRPCTLADWWAWNNSHSTGEPECSRLWTHHRLFHCNCLNSGSLLSQGHTLGGWQKSILSYTQVLNTILFSG